MNLGVATAIIVGTGMFLFLLPPIPGAPIYLAAGVLLTANGKSNGLTVVAAIAYASAVSLVIKLAACVFAAKIDWRQSIRLGADPAGRGRQLEHDTHHPFSALRAGIFDREVCFTRWRAGLAHQRFMRHPQATFITHPHRDAARIFPDPPHDHRRRLFSNKRILRARLLCPLRLD